MTNFDVRASLPLPQTPPSDTGKGIGTVTTFAVTGMTCGHCVVAVTEEISAVPGVTDVTVDLAPGATSTVYVTSDAGVTRDQISAALDEAGDYHIATG